MGSNMEVSANWKKFMKVAKSNMGISRAERNHGSGEIIGKKKRRQKGERKHGLPKGRDQQQKTLTQAVAMDCEMVGIQDGSESILARVSVVNSNGQTLYDNFVKPTEPVVDYRTSVSGVRPKDLDNGVDFKVAQKAVAALLKGRILVGHDLKNDLSVLFLSHPRRKIRDTSRYGPFRNITHGRTPSLKKLAKEILDVRIQGGEHSSVEDARAAMQLYNLFKKDWEPALNN